MSPEKVCPQNSWEEVLSSLKQSKFDYFPPSATRENIGFALNDSLDQSLVFLPIMSWPIIERMTYFRDLGAGQLQPQDCRIFLRSQSMAPLCLSFDEIRTLTEGRAEPSDFVQRGLTRGVENLGNYLVFFHDLLTRSIPCLASGINSAGLLRDREQGSVYHICYVYPVEIGTTPTLPPYQDLDFLENGREPLLKLDIDNLGSLSLSDFSKAVITSVINHILTENKMTAGIVQRTSPDTYDALQGVLRNRPEIEEDLENFLDTFFVPLYRQYAQFLLYCYKRLKEEHLSDIGSARLDENWKRVVETHFILITKFPSKQGLFPRPIRVDWGVDQLTPGLLSRALDWWEQLTDLHNWYPKKGRPIFCYLKGKKDAYPDLARIFLHDMQISEFDRRLYVPNYFGLTPAEQQALWDFMAERYEGLIDPVQKRRIFEIFNKSIADLHIQHPVILDACCGPGLYAEWMKPDQSKLAGLDYSPKMIKRARATGRYDVLMQQAVEGPIAAPDESFDGILLSFASHLIDLKKTAPAFCKKLKPSGILVINFYDPQPGWDEEWQRELSVLGFETIKLINEQVGDKEINVLVLRKSVAS